MKVLVDEDFLAGGLELICDKIRLKTGGTGVLAFPVEIAEAVESIETGSGGITPTGKKVIEENGTYDVTVFAEAEVAVPIPAGPSGKITITANGTGIDVAQYAEADVAVPTGITPSGVLPITQNTPAGQTVDVTNYAGVTVAVTPDAQIIDVTVAADAIEITVPDVVMKNGSVTGLIMYAVGGISADQQGAIYTVWKTPNTEANYIGKKYYYNGSYSCVESPSGGTSITYNATAHTLRIRASSNTSVVLKQGSYKLIVW